VKALLDTRAILYLAADPARLGQAARRLVEDPATILFASLASLWEIAIKARLGKVELPVPVEAFWTESIARARLTELPIERRSVLRTMELDLSHRDPFDRLLAAQALCAGVAFISENGAMDAWGVERIW
jgi:PIN domain nuclease of toxin-antitoxin system